MLEAEKIKQNWETYRDRVNDLFPTRKDQLNKMYDDFEDRIAMMPASSMAHFHNAFAGGYVDHVLRVMDCARKHCIIHGLYQVLICRAILKKN
jgi:hypothetical protein